MPSKESIEQLRREWEELSDHPDDTALDTEEPDYALIYAYAAFSSTFCSPWNTIPILTKELGFNMMDFMKGGKLDLM